VSLLGLPAALHRDGFAGRVQTATISLTMAVRLYAERSGPPEALLNRLIRVATLTNSAFYKALTMRQSV